MLLMSEREDKRRIRRLRREARRDLAARRQTEADDAALAQAVGRLADDLGLVSGDVVTLYEARPGEPPTAETTRALQERGLVVIVPITLPDLDLDWSRAGDPVVAPLGKTAIEAARLVLVPGLSVDAAGHRLGQGGGCYDRALPRRAPGAPVLVLLHPGEVLAEGDLVVEAHDQPVDGVVTAEGVRWVTRRDQE